MKAEQILDKIPARILELRGERVLLDTDLAQFGVVFDAIRRLMLPRASKKRTIGFAPWPAQEE